MYLYLYNYSFLKICKEHTSSFVGYICFLQKNKQIFSDLFHIESFWNCGKKNELFFCVLGICLFDDDENIYK